MTCLSGLSASLAIAPSFLVWLLCCIVPEGQVVFANILAHILHSPVGDFECILLNIFLRGDPGGKHSSNIQRYDIFMIFLLLDFLLLVCVTVGSNTSLKLWPLASRTSW